MKAKILSGIVEGDETFLGSKEKNKHANKKLKQGRGAVGKTTVFGMKDRDGQVMAKVVESTSAEILQGKIKKNVADGSTICTDQHSGYDGLDSDGKFVHKKVKHSAKQFVDGMAHTNGIKSVWAILKRSFYGTFHWFSRTHTQLYLDEVVFRLNINEGNCRRDTVDRLQSLVQGVKGKRLTWKTLVHGI